MKKMHNLSLTEEFTEGDELSCDGDSVVKYSSVTFSLAPRILKVKSLMDLSSRSRCKLWYQAEEYDDFNLDCEESARLIEQGMRFNSKKNSSLGLETWTVEGNRRRWESVDTAWDAVLEEQFAQWDDGVEDPEAISEVYREYNKNSAMKASCRAMMLEREVQHIMAQAVAEYPALFVNVKLRQQSSYLEKIKVLSHSYRSTPRSPRKTSRRHSSPTMLSRDSPAKSPSGKRRSSVSGALAPGSPTKSSRLSPSSHLEAGVSTPKSKKERQRLSETKLVSPRTPESKRKHGSSTKHTPAKSPRASEMDRSSLCELFPPKNSQKSASRGKRVVTIPFEVFESPATATSKGSSSSKRSGKVRRRGSSTSPRNSFSKKKSRRQYILDAMEAQSPTTS